MRQENETLDNYARATTSGYLNISIKLNIDGIKLKAVFDRYNLIDDRL